MSVKASISPFSHQTQVDTSRSKVLCMCVKIDNMFSATCELACKSVWPDFASPYASSAFANLRRLAFGLPLGAVRDARTPVNRTLS